VLNEDQSWERILKEHGENADDYLIALNLLGYLNAISHMNLEDFIACGFSNLLPRAVQEFFDIFQDIRAPRRGDKKEKNSYSYNRKRGPKRWVPHGWVCSCKNTKTFWVETEIKLVDHVRIYCDSCFKHLGWGSPDEFEKAYGEGHATWLEHTETGIIEKLKPVPVLQKNSRIKTEEAGSSVYDD